MLMLEVTHSKAYHVSGLNRNRNRISLNQILYAVLNPIRTRFEAMWHEWERSDRKSSGVFLFFSFFLLRAAVISQRGVLRDIFLFISPTAVFVMRTSTQNASGHNTTTNRELTWRHSTAQQRWSIWVKSVRLTTLSFIFQSHFFVMLPSV